MKRIRPQAKAAILRLKAPAAHKAKLLARAAGKPPSARWLGAAMDELRAAKAGGVKRA